MGAYDCSCVYGAGSVGDASSSSEEVGAGSDCVSCEANVACVSGESAGWSAEVDAVAVVDVEKS